MDELHEPGPARDALLERLREEPFEPAASTPTLAEPKAPPPAETTDEPAFKPLGVRYAIGNPVITVRLTHPFVSGERTIDEIALRPPRYDFVLEVLSGQMRHTQMFAEMAGLDEAEILALRWPDAAELIRHCHFLAPDLGGI